MAGSGKNLYVPVHEEQFEKDIQNMKKSGRKSIVSKFVTVYSLILDQSLEGQILLRNFKDHELMGSYEGFRELHVQQNWLIIYKVDHAQKEIYFARAGTHADLFS